MNAGTPLSLLMIAGGAVLRWGVTDQAEGVDLAAIGVILMVVGVIGLLLSLFFWSTVFGGWGAMGQRDATRVASHRREPDVIVDERPRTVVRTERYEHEDPDHRHV